ncbi:Protein CBG00388 [Caenorhabditis briggsae]|uniref:Protein CBG00388 n=1 Tax=Caenorhabditis briggsae TaxID=6238 RepID=A8WMZ1_CAEBR|nr:Protein CBG00388 [Caenorhabditis briggsae]CAP21846.2 Protein CBG00388 [Caenorhabditis briggsae]
MSTPIPPQSPPSTPTKSNRTRSFSGAATVANTACICGNVPIALNANTLADTLKVSPLYKQQDSARWNAAAQVYRTSRAVSPTLEEKEKFGFDNAYINQMISPKMSIPKTPISLEEIADMNRRRHEMEGGVIPSDDDVGPLELEAIAAVHELAHEVEDISVSEMLPRTSDLIFVNVKTQEGSPYTLELTMKGWRIASSHTDCMNGDYTKVTVQ